MSGGSNVLPCWLENLSQPVVENDEFGCAVSWAENFSNSRRRPSGRSRPSNARALVAAVRSFFKTDGILNFEEWNNSESGHSRLNTLYM